MQVALHNYENGILEKAYENVRDKCGDERKKQNLNMDNNNKNKEDSNDFESDDLLLNREDDDDEIDTDVVAHEEAFDREFQISFGPVSNLTTGERNYKMKWHDGEKMQSKQQ